MGYHGQRLSITPVANVMLLPLVLSVMTVLENNGELQKKICAAHVMATTVSSLITNYFL